MTSWFSDCTQLLHSLSLSLSLSRTVFPSLPRTWTLHICKEERVKVVAERRLEQEEETAAGKDSRDSYAEGTRAKRCYLSGGAPSWPRGNDSRGRELAWDNGRPAVGVPPLYPCWGFTQATKTPTLFPPLFSLPPSLFFRFHNENSHDLWTRNLNFEGQ